MNPFDNNPAGEATALLTIDDFVETLSKLPPDIAKHSLQCALYSCPEMPPYGMLFMQCLIRHGNYELSKEKK